MATDTFERKVRAAPSRVFMAQGCYLSSELLQRVFQKLGRDRKLQDIW
jgi:hypothetical protein